MTLTHGLPLWIGSAFLLLSLTAIARPQGWLAFYAALARQGESAGLVCGVLNIMFGAFLLTFHWEWNGWAWVLSLIGVAALAEGLLFALFPASFLRLLDIITSEGDAAIRMLRFAACAKLLLALAILQEWRTAVS